MIRRHHWIKCQPCSVLAIQIFEKGFQSEYVKSAREYKTLINMKVTTQNGQILEKVLKRMTFRCSVNIWKGVHSALLASGERKSKLQWNTITITRNDYSLKRLMVPGPCEATGSPIRYLQACKLEQSLWEAVAGSPRAGGIQLVHTVCSSSSSPKYVPRESSDRSMLEDTRKDVQNHIFLITSNGKETPLSTVE